MAAPEDVHRSQMALASSRQAKLPTLPVVQQNDPIGYYVANIVYVISFTSWLPPLTRLVTCQGQLPAFIDVLGKKLDAADEMLVYNSATKKNKIAINKMNWPLEEKLAQIATTRSEGLPNCTLSAPSYLHV